MSYEALRALSRAAVGDSALLTRCTSSRRLNATLRKARREFNVRFSCTQERDARGEVIGVRVTLTGIGAHPSRMPSSVREL